MRLNERERKLLKAHISNYSGVIEAAKEKGKSLSNTFNSMLVFASADLDDKYLTKQMDEMSDPFSGSRNNDSASIARDSKDAALNYIAGVYAMDKEMSKRTWRDFFKNPFKYIGEKMAFKEQKEKAMRKFKLDDGKFDLMMDNIAEIRGDDRRHGTIDPKAEPKIEEKQVPAKKEEEVYVYSEQELKEQREYSEQMKKENEKIFGELHRDDEFDTQKLGDDTSLENKGAEKSKPVAPEQNHPELLMNPVKND